MPIVMVASELPWINRVMRSPLLKSLLPSDTDLIGMGKLMGIAKQVASERFGPRKKAQPDMLGSFVAHGLTQREAESEILMQMSVLPSSSLTLHTHLAELTRPPSTTALLAPTQPRQPSAPRS